MQKETGTVPAYYELTIWRNNVMLLDSVYGDGKYFSVSHLKRGNYIIQAFGEGRYPNSTVLKFKIGKTDTTHIDIVTSQSRLRFIPGKYKGVCPVCGKSDSLREFVYGLPSPKGWKEIKRKNQISGGCVIRDDNPEFRCIRDSVDFH